MDQQTKKELSKFALKLFQTMPEEDRDGLDDYWNTFNVGLSNEIDINIWQDESFLRITAYPFKNKSTGEFDYSRFEEISYKDI